MQRNLAGISVLQPPLVQAIFNRNAEEVQLLLHKKEDVNALVCIDAPSVTKQTDSHDKRLRLTLR